MNKIIIKLLMIGIFLSTLMGTVYAVEQENKVTNAVSEKKAEEKPTQTKKNETMYVQERCNIRSSYSVDSDRVGGLDAGAEVTVVAEYSNGWYKIKYDGGEAYIKSGILRSTKPEEPEENAQEPETEPEETNQEQPQANEPVVEEPNDGSTDEVPIEDAELINEIGVLPEVGRNIADDLFIGMVVLAISFVIYVKYKFK